MSREDYLDDYDKVVLQFAMDHNVLVQVDPDTLVETLDLSGPTQVFLSKNYIFTARGYCELLVANNDKQGVLDIDALRNLLIDHHILVEAEPETAMNELDISESTKGHLASLGIDTVSRYQVWVNLEA